MRLTSVIIVAATVVMTASPAARQAPSVHGPWLGAWKLNAEKTAAANGRPKPTTPPAGMIFKMVAVRDDVFKYTIESAPPDGSPPSVRAELIGRFDGRDYIEIGNPGADTNRFRIIDSRTYEVIDTKDGKDLLTIRITISADGQTRTSVAKGVNARGEPVDTISIYDRLPK